MDTGITDADRRPSPDEGDRSPRGPEPADGAVTVLGFGPLRDPLPVTVPWNGGTTEDLLEELGDRFPKLEAWVAQAVVLVDGAKADEDGSIRPGSRVELLPPISGG